MEEMRKKKRKNERGSITLFVLVSMLFFIAILILSYTNQVNKITIQKKQLAEIERQYNVEDEMEKIYSEIENESTIQIVLYKPSGEVYNINEWTNEDLTLEIFYPPDTSESNKKYYLDGIEKQYTESQKITENCTIVVEQNGQRKEVNITKIDKETPTVNTALSGGNYEIPAYDSIGIIFSITVADPGGSGIQYAYYAWGDSFYDEDELEDWHTFEDGDIIELTNVKSASTFYFWYEVCDWAGNCVKNSVGPFTFYEECVATATVNGVTTEHSSVQAAIDECSTTSGSIVTLIKDEIKEASTVYSGQDITLELNGKTWNEPTGDEVAFILSNYGNLTVKDSIGNGNITKIADAINIVPDGAIGNYDTSNFTLESGTISSDSQGVVNVNTTGKTYITGGKIESTSHVALYEYENSAGEITVTGGTIFSGEGWAIAKKGSGTVIISGGEIEGNYATTITTYSVINNGTGTMEIKSGTNIPGLYNQAGTLHMYGGTITSGEGGSRAITNTGTLIIDDGTIRGDNGENSVLSNGEGGTAILNGGTYIVGGNNSSILIHNSTETSSLEIYGGNYSREEGDSTSLVRITQR